MVNPCKECTRVEDPDNCGRKECVDWQRWFLVEWDKFNNYYRRSLEKQVTEDG